MSNRKQELESIYNRINALETNDAASDEKLNNMYVVVKDFVAAFKKHDEKEMEKYDKTDEHIQQLNKTVQDVAHGVNILNAAQEIQVKSSDRRAKDLHDFKVETSNKFASIEAKLNKGIGFILAALVLAGTLTFTYDYMAKQVEYEEAEKIELRKSLDELRSRQSVEYGFRKALESGLNGNSFK